jgi:hypothetical protein
MLCGSGETGAPSLTVLPPAGTDHIFFLYFIKLKDRV